MTGMNEIVFHLGYHSTTLSIPDVSAVIEGVRTIAKTVKLQSGVNQNLLEMCVLKDCRTHCEKLYVDNL